MEISEKTSESLDLLTAKFFDLNRSADRIASLLQNEYAMPQTSDGFHHKIAHAYPLIADMVTEIKDRWNMSSVYDATHKDDRTYLNLEDMFGSFLRENVEAYEMIKLTYNIAVSEGDFNVQADLVAFMQMFNRIIAQIITLHDKAEQMPNDYARFDQYFKNFGIVGLE